MNLCQFCGQTAATTHIRHTVNGHTTEAYVCDSCAGKHPFNTFDSSVFGSLFVRPALQNRDMQMLCPTCRCTFGEIIDRGRVGCPDCYETFYDQLASTLRRIHGKIEHIHKPDRYTSESETVPNEIEALKKELSDLIAQQDYEKCAVLRDKIRELEASKHE